jgi:outer membrane receptor for ferrienterochelin and colicin
VQFITIQDPWDPDPTGSGLGASHDLWKVHPWQGSFYLQDRVEYEGFIANLGMRADYWFVGREVERAVSDTTNTNITPETRSNFYHDTQEFFGRRYKAHLSPRIWVSHPISDRTKFFFNYGEFTQFPSYLYVYSKLTSISSESFPVLGNPDLNPQVSIQYEVGGNTQVGKSMGVNLTLFLKDVYDYPTSTRFRRLQGASLVDVLVYLNGDYARTKGFELEVEKRRTGYWSGKASYSYSQATGKGSDPNDAKILQVNEVSASETLLGEAFVYWNRPHKATLNFDLRFDQRTPKHWEWLKNSGINVYVLGQSGRAYTPSSLTSVQAAKPYSGNGPFAITVDTRLNKEIRLSGQKVNLAFYGVNLFDNRVARRIDPFTGEGYKLGKGLFRPSELPTDPAALQYLIDSRISNPSNYDDGRSWRMSVDYDF